MNRHRVRREEAAYRGGFHQGRDVLPGLEAGEDFKCVHIGMEAWDADEDELVEFLKVLADPANRPVFVHCKHGADRTGTAVATYRVVCQGWTKEDAIDEMRSGGFNLGGEQSGHVIFLDHNTTGDGLISALQTLAIVVRSGRSLSELNSSFDRYPQVLVNVPVVDKRPIEELPDMQRAIAAVEKDMAGRGRVLIRYSGTEPKARVMVEGTDEDRVKEIAHELAQQLQRCLGGT